MPGYLVYWKTFWEDKPDTLQRLKEPDWHSRSEAFVRAASSGTELWVVGRSHPGKSGEWRILEHFEVPVQDMVNTARGGESVWRLEGNASTVEVFSLRQPDAEPVLRSLRFAGNTPIKGEGAAIGKYLQSPRELASGDLVQLRSAAAKLRPRHTSAPADRFADWTADNVVIRSPAKLPMVKENHDQIALRTWIQAGLGLEHVRALSGDAKYLFANMIAKYTLAADSYGMSAGAEARLRAQGLDFEATHTRSSLYGKKRPCCFEHAIPATIVRKHLLETDGSEQSVRKVLAQAGPVVVLLRSEDAALRKHGLNSKMPAGWAWGDDPLARYLAAGIQLSDRRVNMKGAIKR